MDKEDFVTYEQALALKELGFRKNCLYYYDNQGTLVSNYYDSDDGVYVEDLYICNNNKYPNTYVCDAPTLAQVVKWLYGMFGLCIITSVNNIDKYWCFIIKQVVFLPDNKPYFIGRIKKESNFTTMEEALSKGITKCLKLLEK